MTLLFFFRPHHYGTTPPVVSVKGYGSSSDAIAMGATARDVQARSSSSSDSQKYGATSGDA